MRATSRGSIPATTAAKRGMSAVTAPPTPKLSTYSDQPTSPSSVVSFRKEKFRQPALACRVSSFAMRMRALPRLELECDPMRERLACEPARDIVARDPGEPFAHHRTRSAGHVRRDDQVRRIPQRMALG